jgi:radical S-adenosyl methionine domain-containing protein 2
MSAPSTPKPQLTFARQYPTGTPSPAPNATDVVVSCELGIGARVPSAVNWHCFKACNYECNFCYARFEELNRTPTMSREDGYAVLDDMARSGCDKVNFVGGEPMLHPHIRAWIKYAKSLGMVTSIVSNGTGIDREFLTDMSGHLDWVGLSIDASSDTLHAQLGRGLKAEIKQGLSFHLARTLPTADLLHEFGVGVKLNTVVTSLNMNDDMSEVVRRVRPHRWKIFQALHIEGENDEDIVELEVKDQDFDAYIARHKNSLNDLTNTNIVAENNAAMLGTYAMVDPRGHVYTNAEGSYRYSNASIL